MAILGQTLTRDTSIATALGRQRAPVVPMCHEPCCPLTRHAVAERQGRLSCGERLLTSWFVLCCRRSMAWTRTC